MEAFTIHDAQRLPHACILASPSKEESLNLAGQIAAAAVCQRGTDAPCGRCRDCRKAFGGIHPDIARIRRLTDSKGQPRREIVVDQIRAMAADAYVLQNEAARKVYIIEEADKMNPEAQNAALKILEEPPAGVVFLLCAENAGSLLPTVRSRCVTMSANAERPEENETARKLAGEFLRLAAAGNEAELCRWCMKNDRLDKSDATAFFESVETLVAERLCTRKTQAGLDRPQLWELRALARQCSAYLQVNVGVRHIFGLLAVKAIAGGRNRGQTIA